MFSAALLFAFYVIYAKPVIRRLGARLFTCIAMIAATFAIVSHNATTLVVTDQPAEAIFTGSAIAAGAVLAVLCTALPSFMLTEAIARIGAGRTSDAGNVGPVVTTVLAVWILGEPFGAPQAVGLTLILLGVGLIGRPGKLHDSSHRRAAEAACSSRVNAAMSLAIRPGLRHDSAPATP